MVRTFFHHVVIIRLVRIFYNTCHNQVISAAKEVWNSYYAGIPGGKEEPILAICSHMIDNPLYLSNYPMGHLIEFQISKQVQGKPLAAEFSRL